MNALKKQTMKSFVTACLFALVTVALFASEVSILLYVAWGIGSGHF
jgi:hypothetical protein